MTVILSPLIFRLGRVFMLAWLSFLAFALYAILNDPFSLSQRVFGLSLLGAMAASYAVFWLWGIGHRNAWLPTAALVLFTLFTTVFTLATPPRYSSFFLLAAIMVGAAYSWRFGLAGVVLIAALGVGCDIARGVSQALVANEALADLLAGLGGVAGRLLVVAYRELSTAREEIARLAVREERVRFARDLHDLLGHSLSVIALKSELAGRLIRQSTGLAEHEINDVERVARQALREVRDAVAGYRQPTLATELAGARTALTAAGIECRVEQHTGALPPQVEAVLAWAVREGATNVIRHSGAQRCAIRLHSNNGLVQVDVVDNGRGGEGSRGSGLSGLSERVEARGGKLEAEALPHEGYRLRVTLPIADRS